MKKSWFHILFITMFLAACASEPMITDMDVLVHQNNGELHGFYEQLQSELKLAKPKSDLADNRRIYIEKVGEKIAEEKEQLILNELDREFEKHSISKLQSESEKITDIKTYSEKIYTDLHLQFEQAISQKKGVILSKQAEYYELTDKDALKKVQLLNEISAIYGLGPDADQIEMQRKAYVDGLFQNAQTAMVSKRYEDVVQLLNVIQQIDSGYSGVSEMRQQLLAADFEQQFWDALGKGQTDKAYETFYKLSKIPEYIQTHPDVVPIAEDMAQYFIAEGDQAMTDKSMDAAYLSYSRSRYISNVIGKPDVYLPGEKKFIDLIDKRLTEYMAKSLIVPAYGSFAILQELMPAHPSVLMYGQKLHDDMLSEAAIKIISAGFTDADSTNNKGALLTSKITQKLLKALPGRLQVFEGPVVATNYSPNQVVSMPNSSSYFVLSGEVLEASINKREEKSSAIKHVLTSYIQVPNPAYTEWLDLSKRKQKEIPQPPVTLEKPVEEDVTIEKTLLEQTGLLSVAYRLANAVSASVVFSDAPIQKETFTAESIKGVEAGLFIQEAKNDPVRSEEEIFDSLSTALANQAVEKIIARIEGLQQSYLKNADQAITLEDFNSAVANYAYYYVLTASAESGDEETLKKLRTYSLRWK